MRAQTVLLLIFIILFSVPAFSEIYTYIDSNGRLTYTSDPNSLPEGHEHKPMPKSGNDRLKQLNPHAIGSQALRLEHLNQRLELAKIEFDSKFEKLSEIPADEYSQATQDILNLKFEMVDLNEELIELTATNREERAIRLQRVYAWSEKIDLLLEKDRQTNGPQARQSRLEIIALSVEEVKRTINSITYSVKADIDNPGEEGRASVKIAGKGLDGHIIESKTLSGKIGREEIKTLYETVVVEPESALHISVWEVIDATIH